MAVPYEFPFVQAEVGPRLRIVGDEQETRENSFKAVNDACVKIRAEKDDNWGLLIKTGGSNAFGYAADVWLYNLGNGTAQVVDVVGNSEGAPPPEGGPRGQPVPAWGEKDIRGMNEWAVPLPPFEEGGGGGDGGGTEPPPASDLEPRVAKLEEDVAGIVDILGQHEERLGAIEARLTAMDNQLAYGLHAHGPVNLPIVFQSLTSLRAKGDIDVAVKIGSPADEAARVAEEEEKEPVNPAALAAWIKRRRGTNDDDDGGGS